MKRYIILFFGILMLFSSINVQANEIPKQATLYYDNSVTKWSSVYIYIWGPKEHFLPWGSTELKMNSENNICSYTLSLDDRDAYTSFIFWDGGSQQTKDLSYTSEQRIFKSTTMKTKWDGEWYFKDDGRLEAAKTKFNTIEQEWYTPVSYGRLRLAVSSVPMEYNDEYLLIRGNISQYEEDYITISEAFNSLEYSAERLTNKVTELEAKNMTGYSYDSVIAFRNEISEVKAFINEGNFTQESLENNYDKLYQSPSLLIITRENGINTALEELKSEIDMLRELISNNRRDDSEIINLCSKIDTLYKELTNQNSELTDIITKMNINSPEIREQLAYELEKISALLENDNIRVDNLVSGYRTMENSYKNLKVDTVTTDPFYEAEPEIKDSRLPYFSLGLDVVQAILMGWIVCLLFKKRK